MSTPPQAPRGAYPRPYLVEHIPAMIAVLLIVAFGMMLASYMPNYPLAVSAFTITLASWVLIAHFTTRAKARREQMQTDPAGQPV